MTDPADDLKTTPLHALHRARGAKMVPFAGYDMPVQYADGILAEHRHCRAAAGLFDVSHMGQIRIDGGDAAASALEALVPGDIVALAPGQMRYTQLTDENGGILDDLIVTRYDDHLFIVANAANKAADLAWIGDRLGAGLRPEPLDARALIALQGPRAAEVMAELAPDSARLVFMTAAAMTVAGIACLVSRSGYTGEDGFEISLPADAAVELAEILLAREPVAPIGLGARDSLRLEAGLCLHGHDIDTTTTPIEAGLAWSIAKRRRIEGGFPGAAIVQAQLRDGPPRRRVGLRPDGRAPAREGAEIVDAEGRQVGTVSSGGFAPSLGAPVAIGYVETASAAVDTALGLIVRGKNLPARIVRMPFVPQNYFRG